MCQPAFADSSRNRLALFVEKRLIISSDPELALLTTGESGALEGKTKNVFEIEGSNWILRSLIRNENVHTYHLLIL